MLCFISAPERAAVWLAPARTAERYRRIWAASAAGHRLGLFPAQRRHQRGQNLLRRRSLLSGHTRTLCAANADHPYFPPHRRAGSALSAGTTIGASRPKGGGPDSLSRVSWPGTRPRPDLHHHPARYAG